MRRTHLRKHENILKRQLIHVGAFKLSLIFRKLLGAGTPREWNNLGGALFWFIFVLFTRRSHRYRRSATRDVRCRGIILANAIPSPHSRPCRKIATYTTG